jgi:NitT/TauT family transport system substrate-binding protein
VLPVRKSLPCVRVLLLILGLAGFTSAPWPVHSAGQVTAALPAASGPITDAPGAQLLPVRFGSPQSVSDGGVYIAQARGYFREQGLDVSTLNFQSAPDTIPALASGELESSGGNLSVAALNAVERGIGIQMVADKGSNRPGFEYAQLVVRSDLLGGAVRDITDLRGRRIAVAALRSGAESQVAHALARGGMSIDEVDVVPLGYSEMVLALGNRAIDAANIIEPALSTAITRGVTASWEPGISSVAFGGINQGGTLVISNRFAQQPDAARRFLVGYLKGVRAYNDAFVKGEGRAEVVRILTENTPVRDPAVYEQMNMPGLDPDGRIARQSLQLDMDYFRQRGYYTGPVTLDDLIDTSYAEYAAQQLGPYR